MAEERAQRRLAAILAADVVGYSRLMSEDEQGTLNALNQHRTEFIHPTVSNYRGRIVKLMGDGALVEFPSVVDAVEGAVAVQRGMEERNANIPENKRITFRIGINLGDIIIDGDDIYGDGVNVAARLEAEADPGGMCISSDAYRHVLGKVDIAFEDMGERTLKNIAEPIRAYGWHCGTVTQKETATVSTPQLSDKPSIAVLPFDNMSNDPEQEYFSDGLVEDLITDISKISGLFVIARNSSFAFKGQSIDVKEIAKQLGVKHVVEGSVRKMGSRLRINAQLIDAATGGHLWAERYDGDVENIFDFQDDIRDQIVAALQVNLTPAEKNEAQRHLTDSVEAYELFLRARTEFFKFSSESIIESIRLYEQAIEVDPNFAAAYANLSMVLQTSYSMVVPGGESNLDKALRSAEKAVEIDPLLSLAHTRLGWVQCFVRQHDASIKSFERALELSPNDAEAYAYLSHVYNYLGEPERAIEAVKIAFRFDPMLPPNVAFHWGEACFQARQYDEALEKLHECLAKAPGFWNARLILAAALGEMGRNEEAAREVQIVRDEFPDEVLNTQLQTVPYRSKEAHARYVNGVRKAGLPCETLASETDGELALANKPSIIILPFTNLTGDQDQDFLADGLRVDIANAMVKVSGVFIIAMTSSNLYRGKSVEEATNEMGVRYALEGNVRRAGKLLRISTTLTDTELGEIVWAEQFDRELDEAFEVTDEVIGKILTAMNVKLVAGEPARVWHKTLKDLRSLEAFYRGVHEFFKMDRSSISEARRHFELVARLHPESPIGPTWIASTHWYEHQRGWSESREESKRLAREWAEKAALLPDMDGQAHTMLSYIHLLDRDFEAALELGKKGVENRPSCVHSNAFYANALHYCGEQEKARYYIELAMRYSPIHPAYYHDILASTCRATGDLGRAAKEAQKAIEINPNDETARIILASLAIKQGQLSDATRVVREIRNLDPEFSIETFATGQPYRSQEFLDQFVEELRKAGLPD